MATKKKTSPKKKASTKKKVTRTAKKKTAKKVVKKTTRKPRDIVITSPVNPNTQITVASEFADDAMIEAELMGEVLPHFVYKFTQKGQEIVGLSVKGVNETVRKLNQQKRSGTKIRLHPEHLLITRDVEYNGEKGVEVSVFAENLIDGNSAWGIKFESYTKQGKNGKYQNTFAVEKALSKAERNAKRKLIPEVAATKIIQSMLKNPDNVKQIEAPKAQYRAVTPPKPKPTTPDEYEAQVMDYIRRAKTSDIVIKLDVQTQASDKFTPEAKERIRVAASSRVDELDQD